MRHNTILIFMVCSVFLISMSACKEKDSMNNITENNLNLNGNHATSYDQHISTTMSSGVEVNAEVTLPETVSLDALSVHNVRIVTQNFEKAKKILLGSKEIVEEETSETKESLVNEPYRYCRTSDDFTLFSSGENIYFKGKHYDKVSAILDLSEAGNSSIFRTDNNLDFASIKEAQKETTEILKQLNISVLSNPICYTLDYTNLINESEIYNQALEKIPDGQLKAEPISIEKDDECYVFLYQLSANGLPISMHTNGVFGDGSWTSGTSVLCTYSADGLVSLKMDYQLEDLSENLTVSKGLDVGQALERLDQKYNSMLLEGKYLVDSIEFEYVPMPNQGKSNSYTLIPAWRFSILHTFEEAEKGNSANTITAQQRTNSVFHAITGTELRIDFGNA